VTLTALKRFFAWLAGQPGYKSRITYADAEYFNLSTKDTCIAKATRPARVPTLEQIRHVVRSMPASTDIERRDRALIAFTILTGARDGAIASFKLRHIDVAEGKLDQDARDVHMKFSKSFVTTFSRIRLLPRVITANVCRMRSSASGMCFAGPHSPWSPPFAPPAPLRIRESTAPSVNCDSSPKAQAYENP
jgi:hypothetical protein